MKVKIKVEGNKRDVALCVIDEHDVYEVIRRKYFDSGLHEKFVALHNVIHYDHRTPDNIRPYTSCFDPFTETLEITYHTCSLILGGNRNVHD